MKTNKIFYYLTLFCLLSFLLPSCGDDDENTIDTAWKNENEDAFNKIADDNSYSPATIPQGPGTIYYKELKKGNGTISPVYTSQVKVYYKGYLIDGTVFDSRTEPGIPLEFRIDGNSFYSKSPVSGGLVLVSGTSVVNAINGWKVALQNMKAGDKWQIYIPWTLAYGESGYSSIPGYSTLIFEIELVEVVNY